MAVYFIRDSLTGMVKIGHATNPWGRFSKIQSDSPGALTIAAILDGGQPEEAAQHALYASCRARGEWFRCEGELAAFLAETPPPVRASRGFRTPKAEMISRLRSATGEKFQTVNAWVERGSFPAWHFKAIAAAGIYTLEELADLAAAQFAARREAA